MRHRRLNPEELAKDLRRTCAGIPAADLDAAADQVRAMGAVIDKLLNNYRVLPGSLHMELLEAVTPRPHQKDSPVAKVMRLRKELDTALAECAKCHDSDCPKKCPDPDVRSALVGLMDAAHQSHPGATRNTTVARAFQVAQAALEES